ncbi:MAG: hypothetical protein QNI99_00800 [Woeseiaceae bacterium]|nr:hypothetical protein [Woeseiaceae bacterium]
MDRVTTVADVGIDGPAALLIRFGLDLEKVGDGEDIPGSFWGEPEAGVIGTRVYVRGDTPVHSLLHETCHIICMDDERRRNLDRDAGGDDLEESAVCYLQILLADELDGVGRDRIMRDMDAWGYSFRLGSTSRWFADDAEDARRWLVEANLLEASGQPVFRLRSI